MIEDPAAIHDRQGGESDDVMMSSREVIQRLEADGWFLDRVKGSHHQYRHPSKPGVVTVKHPTKDFKPGTLKSMERQSGLTFR